MSEKITIEVFEWEILRLIKKQDSALLLDTNTYFLRYDRARYNQAIQYLIGLKKAKLLKRGVPPSSIEVPNKDLQYPVPGWGQEPKKLSY